MPIDRDPQWYRDAVIYEVHVRAFSDSDGDGMGDFAGLTQRLGYLENLGVTAIWVLPFCPSPWRDDGYDISDYESVHPAYGTLRDFQAFVREAHRRGMRVITELVLNHTSDQHAWFQRSRRAAPGSRWRNFYVWSDAPDRYGDARIIFKDFETSNWTWDPVARAYFWHRFYSHQPDLNFDNPEVRREMTAALDFWFDLGVDGLRLDAVPYLYEREGTNCENLPETHAFLRELRAHIEAKYPDRMLLAEANQWPEDAIAYFGAGDECHMAFHFPLMPRLFMATRMEDRYPITEIMKLTPPIPEACQWAMFLRNHDELTLEMVTDEERDYMYRVYARDQRMRINLGIRRRLAPLLENDRRRIELLNGLLFSMPGTPVVYYGDEIGMGDNIYLGDRNGVRTPMQWSADRNAGFSRANPQRLFLPVIIDPEYHYEAVNVDAHLNNPHSLLWWMRRLISQRKQLRALGRGGIEFLYPSNRRVLAFVREYEGEAVLVLANLSRFTQPVELDLTPWRHLRPVEVFGRSAFPEIEEHPYRLSLAPHAFLWFSMEPKERDAAWRASGPAGALQVDDWDNLLGPRVRERIARSMPDFLARRRWFLSAHRTIRSVEIAEAVDIPGSGAYLLLLAVEFGDGDSETYTLPLSVARGERAAEVEARHAGYILASLTGPDGEKGVLYSGVRDPDFLITPVDAIARRRRIPGERGEVRGSHSRLFRALWGPGRPSLDPELPGGDNNHSTVRYGSSFVLKLYRKLEGGIHPEREMSEFLSLRAGFQHTPPYAGALEYRPAEGEPVTLAVLHGMVAHDSNGWRYTLDNLGLFFERAMTLPVSEAHALRPPESLFLDAVAPPEAVAATLGAFLESARVLGERTAAFHTALASDPDDPAFAPEPFTDLYRHSILHGMLTQTGRTFDALRAAPGAAPAELLQREAAVRARFQPLRERRVRAGRIRIHGDYHLGQVLHTGRDFVIIDLEGDPRRPASERRLKRSPLRDVASMMRSFDYAAHAALFGQVPGVLPGREITPAIEQLARLWYGWVAAAFLRGYLDAHPPALPPDPAEVRLLLQCYLLEQALRETERELALRPEWAPIPIHGILQLVESP